MGVPLGSALREIVARHALPLPCYKIVAECQCVAVRAKYNAFDGFFMASQGMAYGFSGLHVPQKHRTIHTR